MTETEIVLLIAFLVSTCLGMPFMAWSGWRAGFTAGKLRGATDMHIHTFTQTKEAAALGLAITRKPGNDRLNASMGR